MTVLESHYKSVEQMREKRDEINLKISQAIERNAPPEERRELEKAYDALVAKMEPLEAHITKLENMIQKGKSI